MRPLLLALCTLSLACSSTHPPQVSDAPNLTSNALVVSVSSPASRVGAQILQNGGNAVDAAVATAFALAVAFPQAGNIGGGGFMLLRDESGKATALDFRETAPGKATRDMFVDASGKLTDKSLVGHLAAGVPGSVAGLWE